MFDLEKPGNYRRPITKRALDYYRRNGIGKSLQMIALFGIDIVRRKLPRLKSKSSRNQAYESLSKADLAVGVILMERRIISLELALRNTQDEIEKIKKSRARGH